MIHAKLPEEEILGHLLARLSRYPIDLGLNRVREGLDATREDTPERMKLDCLLVERWHLGHCSMLGDVDELRETDSSGTRWERARRIPPQPD